MDVHRAQVSDPVLAEAHWHMMDNRTVEYMDIDEADVQRLLDTLTDAKNNLVQHTGYLIRYLIQWVYGSKPRVPATFLRSTQICHFWSLEAGADSD